MTTLLVVNPYARGGDSDTAGIADALQKLGDVEIFKIGADKSLEDRIQEARTSLKRIVVAGGDGTLNSALPVILESGLPLGVIPLGTANDFARSLNVPNDPLEAAHAITASCTRRVDVGVVNGHYFLNAVGIGLGPELTKHMDRDKKKRLGVLAYLQSLIQVVGQRRRRFATLTIDGNRERMSFLQITVASGRHYGGGMMVSDDVEMDDGLLHVLCVRPLTPVQLFLRGLRIRYGAVEDDEKLLYRSGRKIEIYTRRRSDVTADGELVTMTPLRCHSINKALEVFVPREEAANADPDIETTIETGTAGALAHAAARMSR